MRLHTRIVGAVTAAALATGLGLVTAAPAAAGGSDTKTDQGVSVRLTVKDIKNKTGVVKNKKWIILKVDVPAPTVVGSNSYPVSWNGKLTVTGNRGVAGPSGERTIFIPTLEGSNTFVQSIEFEPTRKPERFLAGRYVASGGYTVRAEVSAWNYSPDRAQSVETVITARAKGAVQNKVRATKPKASSSKVKKNRRVTLSGNVKFQKATPKVYYKWANAKRGSKLALQFKANKAKTWKKVKNVKLGKSGNWSTKVKVKRAGSYRVVVQPTNHYQKKNSKAVKISLR